MSSGERPIGAAKGKQPNTEALCPPPPPLKSYPAAPADHLMVLGIASLSPPPNATILSYTAHD